MHYHIFVRSLKTFDRETLLYLYSLLYQDEMNTCETRGQTMRMGARQSFDFAALGEKEPEVKIKLVV